MARAWPVTDLALDVAQFFDVYHRRTTRLVVAGDMTAHAVEIELLVRRRKRSVRARVLSVVPEFAFALVAGAAHLDAYIVALASRRGQRQLVFEDILIVLVDALVIAIHQTLHRLLAAERGAHFDQTVLKEAALHGNLGLRAGLLLGFQPLQIRASSSAIRLTRLARSAASAVFEPSANSNLSSRTNKSTTASACRWFGASTTKVVPTTSGGVGRSLISP